MLLQPLSHIRLINYYSKSWLILFFNHTIVFVFVLPIVFRLDPVQDSGFGFWLGHPGQKKFKSKRCYFSKKKNKQTKVNELQSSFWHGFAGSIGSHQVFPSTIFSSTWPGSNLKSTKSQIDLLGRAGFQNYGFTLSIPCIMDSSNNP
jgi:hypothetical protein